jgi:competence protein ComEC
MPTALPLWLLSYITGIVLGGLLRVPFRCARGLALAALLLSVGSTVAGRLRGLALLLCALALGVLAQAHRIPVLPRSFTVPLPAVSHLDGEHSLPGRVSLPELSLVQLVSQGNTDAAKWLLVGVVESAPEFRSAAISVRLTVRYLALREGAPALTGPGPQLAAGFSLEPPLVVSLSLRNAEEIALQAGDVISVVAALHSPRSFGNPGSLDRARAAAAIGLQARAVAESEALVRWAPGAQTAALLQSDAAQQRAARATARVVGWVQRRLLGLLLMPPLWYWRPSANAERPSDARALVAALVLGARGVLGRCDQSRTAHGLRAVEDIFRDAGISHVLSVSGLHLAVVGWLFFHGLSWVLLWVPMLARRTVVRRWAALLTVPVVIFYTAVTGAELATVRAAGVTSLSLLAIGLGYRPRLTAVLAASVLGIVWPFGRGTSALLLFEPALQLSVVATLAVTSLRPLRWLTPKCLLSSAKLPRSTVLRAAQLVWRLLDSTTAATLATAPVCAYYFAQIQLTGLLGNLLVVPIGELVILPVGWIGVLLSAVWPQAGTLLISVADGAAVLMLWLATALTRVGGSLWVRAPDGWMLVLWCVGLLSCLSVGVTARVGRWLCAVVLFGYMVSATWPQTELTATFLDVGQGDATVLELPGGGVIVIDAGMRAGGYDLGAQVVGPYLRRHGHRHIDILVASHPHPDHFGGLKRLVEDFSVGEVWAMPIADAEASSTPTASRGSPRLHPDGVDGWQDFVAAVVRRQIPLRLPHSLRWNQVLIEPLAPCANSTADRCVLGTRSEWRANDNSIVLRVQFGGHTILLPGDLEQRGEHNLLFQRGPELNDQMPNDPNRLVADILKAPHHCSRTSSTEALLAAVHPQWVVCSLGYQNRYHFPHAEVVARYRKAGAEILRTDDTGAAVFRLTAKGEVRVAVGYQEQRSR